MSTANGDNLSWGRVHKQIEGPDLVELNYTTKIAGRDLTVTALVPKVEGAALDAVVGVFFKLRDNIAALAGDAAGIPLRIQYDRLTPAPADVVEASIHTRQQIFGGSR
jgi:hypothetical protein